MCGIASAELVEDWPHEQRNVMPDDIEGVMYDFEEGSNCVEFRNQYPEIATFLTVLGTQPYGTDWPSYVTYGGNNCGNTRCFMRIYPWCGYYDNGTPYEYVFVVNGRSAFSPMTGPDHMGGFIPGTKTHIVFKEDTRYVSFLACSDGNMYVDLYDRHGNRICSEKITTTVYRTGTNPSNWTEFSFYSENTDIVSMKIRGNFNGHHIDDLIIGGAPGYLPDQPIDYSWAAERLELLVGAPHNPNGFGYEFLSGTFYPAEDIVSNPLVVNWDYENKEWTTGEGINIEGAIIWTFNKDANIINNPDLNDMASKDFKVLVEYGDHKPGDVAFIEYDTGDTSELGIGYDEVIVFVEPHTDKFGMTVDCIRVSEEDGVHYTDSEFLHGLYGTTIGPEITSLFTVKSMPDSPKGNKKSPYPKIPSKYRI